MTNRRMMVPTSLFTLALCAGCYTLDAYTGERKVSKTTQGAAIGAVVGAAAGLLTGDDSRERRRRALIGAGVGALGGGAVGRYMDAQEAKLRQRLANSGVGVQRVGDEIQLIMPGNITFATGQASLRSDFFDVLNSVALVLDEYDQTLIDVVGFTDNTGATAYNQSLSERRAQAVARYLSAQGVNQARIGTAGAGESQPIASNSTPSGRQQNRRVELSLVPLT